MNNKMIVKPKIGIEDFFKEQINVSKKSTLFNIKFGLIYKPIFKLDSCIIKYPLGRFDKIVIEHEYEELFNRLNNSLKNALGSDSERFMPIKNKELGVKITELTKSEVEKFKRNDAVDVLVEFNNCWFMAGKIYTSFILKDIKKSDNAPATQKEIPFRFTDI